MSVKWVTTLLVGVTVVAGCSDNARVRLDIEGITSNTNAGLPYIEADLVGSKTDPCATIQDQVTVALRVSAQGTIGPQQDVTIYSYTVNYFYFDPNDGQTKGPVALLAFSQNNVNLHLIQGQTSNLIVPVGTFLVKTWSFGLSSCFGVPGFSGPGVVNRMIAQISVKGETLGGKKVFADGSILLYIREYAPEPEVGPDPANPIDKCANFSLAARVASLCPP